MLLLNMMIHFLLLSYMLNILVILLIYPLFDNLHQHHILLYYMFE